METGVRRRRWPRALGIVFVLVLVAALVAAYFLRPSRLTAMILDGAGRGLRADLHTDGPGHFSLFPEPRVVLPGLSASLPGQSSSFFHAAQVEVALPWQTVRGSGSDIDDVVLESPDVDLPALRAWLATLPPSTTPFTFPHLVHGMRVHDGSLRDGSLRIEHGDLAFPSMADGAPVSLVANGDFVHGTVASKFELVFAATTTGVGHGMRFADSRTTLKSDGELPSLTAEGDVSLTEDIAIDLRGSFQRVPQAWSDAVDSALARDGDIPFAIALDKGKAKTASGNPLEALIARHGYRLHLALGDAQHQPAMSFDADATTGAIVDASVKGQLSRWPNAWPIPASLPSGDAPIAVGASYKGPVLMTSPIEYEFSRGDASAHGQVSFSSLISWATRGLKIPLLPDAPQNVEGAHLP